MPYSLSLHIKIGVGFTLFMNTVKNLGTAKHKPYIDNIISFKDIGCFALTELSHGSNVQGIKTTATFDKATYSFVINTPSEADMKFWIGGAAKTATVCAVWA